MALEKRNVPLDVAVSANQKVDPHTLKPGTPTLVKNIRYQKANRIDKRPGYTALSALDTAGATITGMKGIIGTDYNLLLHAGDKVYDYVEGQDAWREVGYHIPCETTITSINETGEPVFVKDSLFLDGYMFYVYSIEKRQQGQQQAIYLIVTDATTGQVFSGPTKVNEADDPFLRCEIKLINFNGGALLFYNLDNSDEVYARRLGDSYTNFMDTETLIIGDVGGNADLEHFINRLAILNWEDTRIVIAYRDTSSSTTVNIRYFDGTLTELTGAYALRQLTSMDCDEYIQLVASSSADRFFVISSNTVTGPPVHSEYDYAIINEDGSLNTGVTSLTINSDAAVFSTLKENVFIMGIPEAYASKDGVRLQVVLRSSLIYQFDDATFQIHLANDGTLNDVTTAASDFPYLWDLVPVSRELTYNGRVYQVWHRYANNDNSLFLITFINNRPYVVSQVLWGRVLDFEAFYPARRADGNLNQISSGVFEYTAISKDSASEVPGIVSIKFDFNSAELFTGVPYGKSMLIAGTNLHSFDGINIREHGFFHRPKAPILTQGAHGSTAIADGTYSVLFVFEYTDRNGLLHRSPPSDATSITISSGSGNANISAVVSCYTITNLLNSDPNENLVKIIPYRTTDGGTIYYREANFPNRAFFSQMPDPEDYNNDVSAQKITIILALSDSNLSTQPVLYTDSGEIPPAPIPPIKYLSTWNKRIIAGGTPRDESVFYSKLNQINLAPEFTEAFSIGIQDLPGRTSGLSGFSDKLILSKRGRLFYSYGEGPDNTGQGGGFALFEQILGVSGAVNGKSLAVNKEGLYFKSDKGMYVLSGGLATEHIGAYYEDVADTSVIKTLSPITSETIRMLTSSGIIEHDTFFGGWSLQTGLTPVDAAIYDNDFYLIADDDIVYKENRSVFKDGSASYGMYLETGWISMAGVSGFQRLYSVFVKATYKSVHTLKVSIAYDYGSYVDEVTIDPADATDDDVYRFKICATTQKCEAFRLKFEEIITDGTAGTHESLQLNFISIVVGIKRGLPKIKDAQKVGVSSI